MREMWQELATAHHLPDLFLVVILSAVLSMLFYTNLVWVRNHTPFSLSKDPSFRHRLI
jgi:hypothetical protein